MITWTQITDTCVLALSLAGIKEKIEWLSHDGAVQWICHAASIQAPDVTVYAEKIEAWIQTANDLPDQELLEYFAERSNDGNV